MCGARPYPRLDLVLQLCAPVRECGTVVSIYGFVKTREKGVFIWFVQSFFQKECKKTNEIEKYRFQNKFNLSSVQCTVNSP